MGAQRQEPLATLACGYCGAPADEPCRSNCPAPDDGEGGQVSGAGAPGGGPEDDQQVAGEGGEVGESGVAHAPCVRTARTGVESRAGDCS